MKVGDIVLVYSIERWHLHEFKEFHRIEEIIGNVYRTKKYCNRTNSPDKFRNREVIHKTHVVFVLNEEQIKELLEGE